MNYNNKLSKLNMADAALARREARRRRILENSSTRLQIISNITNNECSTETPVKSVTTSIPKQNNEIPPKKNENVTKDITNNGVISSNESISVEPVSDNINLDHVFFGEQDITNDSAAFEFPKPEQSETTIFEKLTNYKYDLVLLSLFIQTLHQFSVMSFDDTYFFLPLLVYIVTKVLFFPKQENSKYANIMMLLNGMTSQQTLKLMSVLHWMSIAAQDVCIYLFTTVCVQSLFITICDFIS